MPTLLGVGSELWIELEHSAQADAVASTGAHPQNPRGLPGASPDRQRGERRPARTLREDQPRLAEAYQREAERILAREARAWGVGVGTSRTHMEKTVLATSAANSESELAAE